MSPLEMANPWSALPANPPYVLPEDRPYVDAFNRRHTDVDSRYRLELELMAEPFAGNRHANLVILGRNPGIGEEDPAVHRDNDTYVAALRANLGPDPAGHRIAALLPEFQDTPGGRWWRTGLVKALLMRGFRPEELAQQILAVEFHGYHSKDWCAIPITLPSQHFGFLLVREAIRRGAMIVVMRGRTDWEIAVPELGTYVNVVHPHTVRRSFISPGNCGAEAFELIIRTLES